MNIIRHLLLALLTIVSLVFHSCMDKDYYDESKSIASKAELFSDSVSISDSFDWSTTKSVNLSVAVDDQYSGQYFYRVDVYDENPLFSQDAKLLGAGVAKSGQNFVSEIVVPTGLQSIYVKQTDPTKGETFTAIDVTSTELSYKFSETSTAAVSNLASASLSSVLKSVASASSYSLPSNYKDISETSGYLQRDLSQGPYLISGNAIFSGVNFWNSGDIYVTGTFEVTSDFQLPYGSRLIVLGGGVLKIGGQFGVLGNSTFYNGGSTIVGGALRITNTGGSIVNDQTIKAGSIEVTNDNVSFVNNSVVEVGGNIRVTNLGRFKNESTVTASSLTMDNGLLDNYGTTTISGATDLTNSTVKLTNYGAYTTKTLSMQGGAKVYNYCHMTVVDNLAMTDVSLYNGDGSLLTTANVSLNNTRIELGSASFMNVTNTASYNYNPGSSGFGFYGVGASKALLKIAKVVNVGYSSIIHYAGNLEIECYDHPAAVIDPWNTRWTQNGVTWAGTGGSAVVIDATDCNGGGYNVPKTETPTDQTATEVVLGSYSYAFEDNWPSYGDYDMNDFVSDIALTRVQNADNKTTKLIVNATLRAAGASKRIAAAIQVDGINASDVKSVTYSKADLVGTTFPLSSNGVETGQTYAVLPICDDVHKAFGYDSPALINTGIISVTPVPITITVEFNSPQKLLTNDDLNVFIVTAGYTSVRTEVHLNERTPTDKVNQTQFVSTNLKSSENPYRSSEGLIWGLSIPGSFDYPKETVKITTKYTHFEAWAQSGGADYTTWYKGN
jgi:LruC domain-containing protein